MKEFKLFCYSFYHNIIKEINNFKYEEVKLLYRYYNPIYLNNNLFFENDVNKSFQNIFISYSQRINTNNNLSDHDYSNILKNNLFKPLISTTERVVDMVMSVY